MSILIGIGVVSTLTVFYLGKKGWHALHKAVGITPGVLTYQDPHTPLLPSNISWQQLELNPQYLSGLSEVQLRQLQRIDDKVVIYKDYQRTIDEQNMTVAITERQFILHKLLYQRLPEMLTSHYHVTNSKLSTRTDENSNIKRIEAVRLLQDALTNIENRLDELLAQMETQHLQDLRVMKRYLDSHN